MMTLTDSFSLQTPKDTVDVLLKRLKTALVMDDELIHYYKDRAGIEDRYAQDLAKLSKRTLSVKVDPESCAFATLWDSMLTTTSLVATERSKLASEITAHVEDVLKTRCDGTDWTAAKQSSFEASLLKSTKDYVDKISKLEKLDQKETKKMTGNDGKSDKLEKAESAVEQARIGWVPEASAFITVFPYLHRNLKQWNEIELLLLKQ